MAYVPFNEDERSLGFFGCGPSCGCQACRRAQAGLGEWYVKDEDEEEKPGREPATQTAPTNGASSKGETEDTVSARQGPATTPRTDVEGVEPMFATYGNPMLGQAFYGVPSLTPEQAELERRIVHAKELWRAAMQQPQRLAGIQFGYSSGLAGLGAVELATAQHLGWIGLVSPQGTLGSRLVEAIKQCLRELGKPNLIARAGAMAACLAGFLAGPEAAPLVWTCLKIMGITLTLAFVVQLLTCVAARMR